ncbi:MAG: hypothetical protein JO316_26405 [Abitibacteriaceae bacterium]|nr:hypothetical protein [Abditibacteriaceae bacterium]
MPTWWYERGNWKAIEDPLGWGNGEFLQEVLKRHGWNEEAEFLFGNFATFETKVYMAMEDSPALEGFKFLVTCGGPNRFLDSIYLKDTPSLLQLLREIAPLNHLGLEQSRELERAGAIPDEIEDHPVPGSKRTA